MKRAGILVVALAACGSFEDENVVIDTRILAMSATPPDQLVDVDLENPQSETELLEQLEPADMCALVADPSFDRRMRWSMTLCVLDNDERCSTNLPSVMLGSGLIADPDIAVPAPRMCVTINPDGNLLGILRLVFEGDTFRGLGGLDYGISLAVGGEDVDASLDLYAGKTVRVTPRIPVERTANSNPVIDHLEASIDGGEPVVLPLGRCVDQPSPLEIGPRATVRITPIESAATREVYVVPTLDGRQQTFTESPTYQWLVGAGGVSSGFTGGPRDFSGNPAPLFTDYRAPRAEDLDGVLDVPVWVVVRDERLGAMPYESCLRVVP